MIREEDRLRVVDEVSGRIMELYDVIIDEVVQDGGRTLKIFVKKKEDE